MFQVNYIEYINANSLQENLVSKGENAETILKPLAAFYQDDPKLVEIPPSSCARRAAEIFAGHNCRIILDLGCGTDRDAIHLVEQIETCHLT